MSMHSSGRSTRRSMIAARRSRPTRQLFAAVAENTTSACSRQASISSREQAPKPYWPASRCAFSSERFDTMATDTSCATRYFMVSSLISPAPRMSTRLSAMPPSSRAANSTAMRPMEVE